MSVSLVFAYILGYASLSILAVAMFVIFVMKKGLCRLASWRQIFGSWKSRPSVSSIFKRPAWLIMGRRYCSQYVWTSEWKRVVVDLRPGMRFRKSHGILRYVWTHESVICGRPQIMIHPLICLSVDLRYAFVFLKSSGPSRFWIGGILKEQNRVNEGLNKAVSKSW